MAKMQPLTISPTLSEESLCRGFDVVWEKRVRSFSRCPHTSLTHRDSACILGRENAEHRILGVGFQWLLVTVQISFLPSSSFWLVLLKISLFG